MSPFSRQLQDLATAVMAPKTSTNTTQLLLDLIEACTEQVEDIEVKSRMVSIHTRPLRSLGTIKTFLPEILYYTVSAGHGFTHWAVEFDDKILQVRGASDDGNAMRIQWDCKEKIEYESPKIQRYAIGVTTKTIVEIDQMRKILENQTKRYHFYTKNCQLIAAVLAVACCDERAAAYKTLINRSDLRFLNRSNKKQILWMVGTLIDPSSFKVLLKQLSHDKKRSSKFASGKSPYTSFDDYRVMQEFTVWQRCLNISSNLVPPETKYIPSRERRMSTPVMSVVPLSMHSPEWAKYRSRSLDEQDHAMVYWYAYNARRCKSVSVC